eukprot:m.21367 g.21367  ORF g.21367 m.21367 type:complete len:235 (+) comp10708_c0_seq1:333-1037(+)
MPLRGADGDSGALRPKKSAHAVCSGWWVGCQRLAAARNPAQGAVPPGNAGSSWDEEDASAVISQLPFFSYKKSKTFTAMADEDQGEQFGTEDLASKTFPMQCSALRKGGHVMIKERPCKIVDMSTSKTGKHGHAKVHLVAIDIFTGKKLEDLSPSTHNMNVPVVKRTDLQLVAIEDNFMHLMDDGGNLREDLQVPDSDVGKEIQTRYDNDEQLVVTILSACDEEMAVAVKIQTK